eukprot:scaffold4556_cov114-Isochrysis_galbana.AAC.2
MPRREPRPARRTRLRWLVLLATSRARLREPQTGSGNRAERVYMHINEACFAINSRLAAS